MRIIVAGQPKTGNVWVKHILASLYDLEVAAEPPAGSAEALQAFVEENRFKPDSIFHEHFWPSDAFFDALPADGCHLVTPLRHPYDAFVSLYHFAQRHPEPFLQGNDPARHMIGKPIGDPAVLHFLENDFGGYIQLSLSWLVSGRSSITRYEDLCARPVQEVQRLAREIEPVGWWRARRATRAASAKKLRRLGGYWQVHIRAPGVDDWKNHLTEAHLSIFETRYGKLIEGLGYRTYSDLAV
ncbi:MAG: sulfotransferase domain-containing protein [Chloroflexota bacterium]